MESDNRGLRLGPREWMASAIGATLTVAPFLILEGANQGSGDFRFRSSR